MKFKNYGSLLVILFLSGGLMGCSKVKFDDVKGVEGSAKANPDEPADTAGTGDNPPQDDGTSTTTPPPQGTLRLYTQVMTCAPQSNCVVDYYLTEAMAEKLEFTWQTNDTKYLEDAKKYARPGVNYVAASGSVVFNAGETHKQIIIQSLSGFTAGMEIPFLWDNCVYGGEAVDCRTILLQQ
jgi:hypothetical protein